MKDVVAVLGEWQSDGPIHVELVARGVKDAGLKKTTEVGLKEIATALASCPPLAAGGMGPVSVEIGSENGALTLAVKIGSVNVNVVIRADAEMIGDNADVTVNE